MFDAPTLPRVRASVPILPTVGERASMVRNHEARRRSGTRSVDPRFDAYPRDLDPKTLAPKRFSADFGAWSVCLHLETLESFRCHRRRSNGADPAAVPSRGRCPPYRRPPNDCPPFGRRSDGRPPYGCRPFGGRTFGGHAGDRPTRTLYRAGSKRKKAPSYDFIF